MIFYLFIYEDFLGGKRIGLYVYIFRDDPLTAEVTTRKRTLFTIVKIF